MLSSERSIILQELACYTTFLAGSLSSLAAPTFCELLIGAMLSTEGFLTQALLTNGFENVWSSYHHWVSKGHWQWKTLARRLIKLVGSQAPSAEPVSVLLDDFIVERCSEKAPACRTHRQHSRKKNRPDYILGQCWVALAIAFERKWDEVFTAIPVMAFPSPASGNVSKLRIARAMLSVVREELQGKSLQLLTDCWYMNATMMLPAIEQGYEIFGQIPKNRALFALPPDPQPKRRGRKKKYGIRLTADEVGKMPEYEEKIWMYGKLRTVHYRTCVCRARFLRGQTVRVVWSRYKNDKGLTEVRLFLCTNPGRTGHEILRTYAKRWPIESLFQQMKHTFGFRHFWQRKLRTLLRWMHIKMAGYALLQLLTVCHNKAARAITDIPWRNPDTVTAGMLRKALSDIISRFAIRACWNPYHQKFEFNQKNRGSINETDVAKAA